MDKPIIMHELDDQKEFTQRGCSILRHTVSPSGQVLRHLRTRVTLAHSPWDPSIITAEDPAKRAEL